jgi:hypothetical protein
MGRGSAAIASGGFGAPMGNPMEALCTARISAGSALRAEPLPWRGARPANFSSFLVNLQSNPHASPDRVNSALTRGAR